MPYFKNFYFLLIGIFVADICFSQVKCDCSLIPYKPDSCFKKCAAKLLGKSTELDLKLIIGLDDTLTNHITEINKSKSTKTLEEYLSNLDDNKKNELEENLNKLNKDQLKYLQKPIKDRVVIMAQMQEKQLYKKG